MPLVLIVDDNPENLTVVGELLLPHCDVRVAHSGARALQLARLAPTPDLILLDVMMPGMDGYQVMQQLQAQPEVAAIPVIFLSALDGADDELRGLQLGAVDFVGKPIRPAVLLARVHAQLSRNQTREREQQRLQAQVAEWRRRLADSRRLLQATLQAMARLADGSGHGAGRHPLRTQAYVRSLALRLCRDPRFAGRIDTRQAELLADAAPLHDIGEISVPAALLGKPGRLDADERRLMQTHAQAGADAIAGVISEADGAAAPAPESLHFARLMALGHHERWDGSGYPDGLAGDAIPLPARLLALADVYDALTSHRPYKSALSHDTAVATMLSERGRHFDPALIDAFVECHAEWRDIAVQLADIRVAPGATAHG